jgi:hypothetical protein
LVDYYQQQAGGKDKDDNSIVQLADRGGVRMRANQGHRCWRSHWHWDRVWLNVLLPTPQGRWGCRSQRQTNALPMCCLMHCGSLHRVRGEMMMKGMWLWPKQVKVTRQVLQFPIQLFSSLFPKVRGLITHSRWVSTPPPFCCTRST